jgi:hypothetical protein
VIVALQGYVIVALQGCVIFALQGCVTMLRYCCVARLRDCCVEGCVIVVLQCCVIVLLRARLRDCCVARSTLHNFGLLEFFEKIFFLNRLFGRDPDFFRIPDKKLIFFKHIFLQTAYCVAQKTLFLKIEMSAEAGSLTKVKTCENWILKLTLLTQKCAGSCIPP